MSLELRGGLSGVRPPVVMTVRGGCGAIQSFLGRLWSEGDNGPGHNMNSYLTVGFDLTHTHTSPI